MKQKANELQELLIACLEEEGYRIPKQHYAEYSLYSDSGYVGFDILTDKEKINVTLKWG